MNDHLLSRFGAFAMSAGLAAFLFYWFRRHLHPNVICVATAALAYAIHGFLAPPFFNVPPLGSKQLRASILIIGLMFMTAAFLFQILG